VKIITLVVLGGCAIAAAKPGDLDRKFDPELRAWVAPEHATVAPDGRPWIGGGFGWLYVHATLAAGPAELHRLSFTGRLDRTFDSPRFGDRARQAAGDWWTAEEAGRVGFDPALQESLASPQAILWHPESRRLWVGGGVNAVNGQPRDGLARIVGGLTRSR
jgi:hypothetical protein